MTNHFYSSGGVISTGALSCEEEVKVSGKACFDQSVTAKEVFVSGTLESLKQMSSTKIKVSGRVRAKSVTSDDVFVSGSMMVDERFVTQILTVSGWLKVAGEAKQSLLNQ